MNVQVGLKVFRLSGAEDNSRPDWSQYNLLRLREGSFVVDARTGMPGVFVVEKIITDKEKFPENFTKFPEAVIMLREILCTNTLQYGWVKGEAECERECAHREKCPFRSLLMIRI